MTKKKQICKPNQSKISYSLFSYVNTLQNITLFKNNHLIILNGQILEGESFKNYPPD